MSVFLCYCLCNRFDDFIACHYAIHFLLIVFFLVFIWRLISTMGMDSYRIVEAFYIAEYDRLRFMIVHDLMESYALPLEK